MLCESDLANTLRQDVFPCFVVGETEIGGKIEDDLDGKYQHTHKTTFVYPTLPCILELSQFKRNKSTASV